MLEASILGELNSTHIYLIQKVYNPAKVEDFFPISCCNLMYKGMAKIIVNRLKSMIESLVSNNQNLFISGKHIKKTSF